MDKREAIKAVSKTASEFTHLPDELKEDRDVVMATVSKLGIMLMYMEPRFQADKEIVMAAVMNFGPAIQFASPELKEDKEVAIAAVRENGRALDHLLAFKRDMDVVTTAVMNHGSNIRYASPELQKDPELINLAIYHGHRPTEEQRAIVARERSSKELHKYDAELLPFDQFKRGVRKNLQERYEHTHTPRSIVGMLNNQGPNISEKIMREISSYGPKPLDRGKFPRSHRIGGKRRKRTKRK